MNKYAAYFAIEAQIKDLGFDPNRHELISQFTSGTKNSLSALSTMEYKLFLNWLKKHFKLEQERKRQADVRNNKRRRVIAQLAQAGYVIPETGKPDMKAIEAWVLKQKHKKPFNALSSKELSELIVAAEKVAEHFRNSIK